MELCTKTGLVQASKFVLVFLLLACFGGQVWEGFLKFIKRQTTLVSTTETKSEAKLPAISVCPGFRDIKHDYYEAIYELHDVLDENEDSLDATPMNWWNNKTYGLTDFIHFIKRPSVHYHEDPETHVNVSGYYEDLKGSVIEVSTNYGRCYAFHFDWMMKSKDYYTFQLNMENHEELVFFLHERYNEIGLHWSFWPIVPVSMTIRKREGLTLDIKTNTFKSLSSLTSCTDEENYSYTECVTQWTRQRYQDMFKEHNKTGCWYPAGQYLAVGSNFPPCKTKEEESFARGYGYSHIVELFTNQSVTGCLRSCTKTVHEIHILKEPTPSFGGDTSRTYFYLIQSMTSEHVEEIYAFDFNTIVSYMGGSLGLFLGISFFSIFTYVGGRMAGLWNRSGGSEDQKENRKKEGLGSWFAARNSVSYA